MANRDAVLYSEEDGLAWLTLNRPESLNALDPEMLAALAAATDDFREGTRAFLEGRPARWSGR